MPDTCEIILLNQPAIVPIFQLIVDSRVGLLPPVSTTGLQKIWKYNMEITTGLMSLHSLVTNSTDEILHASHICSLVSILTLVFLVRFKLLD